jgi:ferrous iron transport protein B
MARAAFVMDRLMQALGLPGKSFVPLIVGFGCNVPSVMGARTLDAPRERLMTIMMAPFMSCGARLAIFAVFAAAFFGQQGAGGLLAVRAGHRDGDPDRPDAETHHHARRSVTVRDGAAGVPRPHLKSLVIQTWQRLKGFVLRAGKVIVIVSIFLSALNSFTLSGQAADNINDSALASVSRVITPVFKPIGVHEDNWQATVGLFTGAKRGGCRYAEHALHRRKHSGAGIQSGRVSPR